MSAEPCSEELHWEDVPALMEELRELARRLLTRWPGMHSLQPTLLVATALRRARASDQRWEEVTWENRAQFFGQMARAMKWKLVEYRRHQRTQVYRARSGMSAADLETYRQLYGWLEDPELAELAAAALDAVAGHPELVDLVTYRFFLELSWDETAQLLERPRSTTLAHWKRARLLMEAAIRTRRAQLQREAEGG